MSAKKIMSVIIIIGIMVVLGFAFFLYATIKTKSTNINEYKPFKNWVGRTVTLNKEVVLLTEKVRLYDDKKYPYLMLDSLHPYWHYLDERIQLGDYKVVKKLPAGTAFHIEKAVQFTGGVSGNSTPFIFGNVRYKGKSYGVGYQWGKMDIAKFMDKMGASWYFHQAPWQAQIDSTFYALPEAKWR